MSYYHVNIVTAVPYNMICHIFFAVWINVGVRDCKSLAASYFGCFPDILAFYDRMGEELLS